MIPGKTTATLNNATVTEALRRFLCAELKEPVKVVGWKKTATGGGYGQTETLDVDFEPDEAAASAIPAGPLKRES